MKTKITILFFAVISAVALAFGNKDSLNQNTLEAENTATSTNHYLKPGMSASDALNASNYQSTLPDGIECGEADEVPCLYIFTPSVQYPTFQDLLNSKNTTTVVTDADEKREQ